ncbi:hypothetical protein BOTBODRAFT_178275 [Botryobasidium botryosum FD-172 SS1]|uniref:Uncharacterized protein n=1 Tax=Botryobasidium botryosum (strain FD-172 SS1) TaxID=930990 RepID=A0A067M6A3_BOTB1|nr:hypothetical protein BOTBODRAFT_178275 [Botryobasidium botryosum FD-172 SS1]
MKHHLEKHRLKKHYEKVHEGEVPRDNGNWIASNGHPSSSITPSIPITPDILDIPANPIISADEELAFLTAATSLRDSDPTALDDASLRHASRDSRDLSAIWDWVMENPDLFTADYYGPPPTPLVDSQPSEDTVG